jgi:uncharacterized phage protein (TIGR01671 family)
MTMREILFRGKRIDNGEWVDGGYYHEKVGEYFTAVFIVEHLTSGVWETHRVDPKTVGQFTGLTDKNGKKIFEGDVVRHWNGSEDGYDTGCVYWDAGYCGWRRTTDGSFHKGLVDTYRMSASCDYEIIGNIHDNPELLEGE